MGLKCGIVGLPNVGKSTLFNALTRSCISAENYPFCTIEPNNGIVTVPDPRLQQIAAIVNPKQIIPTQVEFVDIAGLVAGASQGDGLGNKFLAHIRETDAIIQVVRCFSNDNIVHVAGKIDPVFDADIIHTELCIADQQTLEKALLKNAKLLKSVDKDAEKYAKLLTRLIEALDSGQAIRGLSLTAEEQEKIVDLHLLTAKPMLYVANIADTENESAGLSALCSYAEKEKIAVLSVCANIEAEIAELPATEQAEFLQHIGVDEPGLHRLIRSVYAMLDLQTFITAGEKEVRAWTIKKGASALQAAGSIHSDFARGFIAAEVINFADYLQYKGEQGAKDAGKWRVEGKYYIVQDGDVMLFRFNV